MATITGDDGPNLLLGTLDADVISGLGGNDTLRDLYNNIDHVAADSLFGGDGDDLIYGNAPGYLDGGQGNDTVSYEETGLGPVRITLAEAGTSSALVNYEYMSDYNDWYGTTVRDFGNVIGSKYDDTITGDSQDNLLLGLAGDDVIDGGGGNDTLDGGDGIDIVSFWDASAGINFQVGATTFAAPDGGTVTMSNFEGVYGTRFQDTITGTAGADYIDAKSSSDLIYGGVGDTIIGGVGRDTLDFGDITDGLSIWALRSDQNVGPGRMIISGIETFRMGAGADTIRGYSIDEVFVLRGGNDWADGSTGQDRLFGGSGFDTLYGGAGTHGDYLDGGADYDLLLGMNGDDTLIGGTGNDSLYGGNGFDIALFTVLSASANVVIDLAVGTAQQTGAGLDILDHIEGVEVYGGASVRLQGTGSANLLASSTGRDSLYGGAGDDTLDGGAGNDDLYGGTGIDMLRVTDSQAVTINLGITGRQVTGQGNDLIRDIEGVTGGGGRDHLMGNATANALSGGTGSDTISGGAGDDTLNGGRGNDMLYGGAGNDRALYSSGVDVTVNLSLTVAQNTGEGIDTLRDIERLTTGAGNDHLTGTANSNVLISGGGNDVLFGGGGNDLLQASVGDDSLYGGVGNDTLTGGDGSDQFFFHASSGVDRVTDFTRGQDKIVISWSGHDFSDLTLSASGSDAKVQFGQSSIVLTGLHFWDLTASDFVFI